MTPKLLNRPPSKGPEPKIRKPIYKVVVKSKDLPPPPPKSEAALARAEKLALLVAEGRARGRKRLLTKALRKKVLAIKHSIKRAKKRKAAPILAGTYYCHSYPIHMVADLTINQAVCFLEGHSKDGSDTSEWFLARPTTLKIRLDYPLSRPVEVTIEPLSRYGGPCGMEFGHILWCLAREYKRIYAEEHKILAKGKPGHYGIWGHAMGDLVFEGLVIG